MRRWSRDAFTLIELLAVIAIIAILAALLFPVINSSFEKGRSAACISNLRQITAATLMYAGDHEGRLPSLKPGATMDPNAQWQQMEELSKYITDPKVFRCPSAQGADSGAGNVGSEIYVNPGNSSWVTDYKMNNGWEFMGKPISSLRHPDWVVCFLDIDTAPVERHRGGRNLSFVDGHVEWKAQKDYRDAATAKDPWGNAPWYAWGFTGN